MMIEKICTTSSCQTLEHLVLQALENFKALNIVQLDVKALTTITDTMFIATGTSDQHLRSMGDNVLKTAKEAGFSQAFPLSPHQASSDWVLLDLNTVVIHIMKQSARDYYALEKLWNMDSDEKIQAVYATQFGLKRGTH